MNELHAFVTGRVQMVMYRDFAQRKGSALGLVGSVRNVPDGSVEIIAQGKPAALEKFLEQLRRGSLLSRVDHVDVEWRNPTASFDAFTILY